jgi:hypothetical protein
VSKGRTRRFWGIDFWSGLYGKKFTARSEGRERRVRAKITKGTKITKKRKGKVRENAGMRILGKVQRKKPQGLPAASIRL